MKIILMAAIMGVVLFFPLSISGYTCMFSYLSGMSYSAEQTHSAMMLENYLHTFALPWWTSIGLAVWSFKKLRKKKLDLHLEDNINA